MTVATVGIVGIVVWLLTPHQNVSAHTRRPTSVRRFSIDTVEVTGPRQITIAPDSHLAKSLTLITVAESSVTHPLMTVTGSVIARIRPGSESLDDRWQFSHADVSSAYADWLKARADVDFTQKQLTTTQDLVKAQSARLSTIVERLEELAPAGSIARKDLLEAQANLVQSQLVGQKDLYAAELALRAAQRERTTLERQMMQAGLEPQALSRAREDMVLVTANVPEAKMAIVQVGQACQARFFALPDAVFSAHVEELGSVVSTELRTLHVLFDVSDPANQLRPGMFAEVGLGTDPRTCLLVPSAAVVHIGRDDYVFAEKDDSHVFEVLEVEVGDVHGDVIEIHSGLKAGTRIVGKEAILLKPVATQALQP